VLNYRAMRWDWKSIMLVTVLFVCVIILIAPNVDLQETALRAMRWMLFFFALITGLATVLFYLWESSYPVSSKSQTGPPTLVPLPDLFSLRC